MRQVLTLDEHRFIRHVGWRQDCQTFDGAVLSYTPSRDFSLNVFYINKRNRSFSDEADVDSKDTILNSSYSTRAGKITGYAYLREQDTATGVSIDTYSVSVVGAKLVNDYELHCAAEFAAQKFNDDFDTDYLMPEGVSPLARRLLA